MRHLQTDLTMEEETKLKRFLNRDWIQKNEGKLTYIQFFGFVLITIGIIYFITCLILTGLEFKKQCGGHEISVVFFTTMMGVSFAFPEMLKGPQSDEMSTMRITVFMLTNVICMLLLKVGWEAQSLEAIGLDSSWVGVIAFLFGAKAVQSYFENANKLGSKAKDPALSGAGSSGGTPTEGGNGSPNISQIAIAQLAKVQNENKLKSGNSNIVSVSDTLLDGKSCLTIYLDGKDPGSIQKFVDVELNETTTVKVQTRVIPGSGPAKPHISQKRDEIQDSVPGSGFGSICCLVKNESGTIGLVTVGHNFTQSNFKDLGGYQYGDDKRDVYLNGKLAGQLLYQKMDFVQDLAIVELTDKSNLLDGYKSFEDYYEVTHKDVLSTANATIESRPNDGRKGSNVRDAYILDCNINYDVTYNGENYPMINVILLGDSPDPASCSQVSMPGDSGSCVYLKDSNKLIGILVGGNGRFSIVLPIREIMKNNYLTIL